MNTKQCSGWLPCLLALLMCLWPTAGALGRMVGTPVLLAVKTRDGTRPGVTRNEVREWHGPEVMKEPFWEAMIRAGLNAYQAIVHMEGQRDSEAAHGPVWCAQRFGQSLTFLPDGRIVEVAGEHEDHYDPDFCIYNDVFVHDHNGNVTIHGYPEALFPPTDFHTATLIGEHIYVIGSLGYFGSRHYGTTPVYRLDVTTFAMERLETRGEQPSWISGHRAGLTSAHTIQVAGGSVLSNWNGVESDSENAAVYTLNVEKLVWKKV